MMDDNGSWQAGIDLYSGRPDPAWPLEASQACEFERRWRTLPRCGGGDAQPVPPLGYRGCRVSRAGSTWSLFAGRAGLTRRDGSVDVRQDPQRALEWWVLGTAPEPLRQEIVRVLQEIIAPGPA